MLLCSLPVGWRSGGQGQLAADDARALPEALEGEGPAALEVEEDAPPALWDLARINDEIKGHGVLLTAGMDGAAHEVAMARRWEEVHPHDDALELTIDLRRQYTYRELEEHMVNLARHDGVFLHVIGLSAEGRSIYGLTIDFGAEAYRISDGQDQRPALLYLGGVHGNEFAGSVFILKQFGDLVRAAQEDEQVRQRLAGVRFEAIPVVNPDSREKNRREGRADWKANANGVDINRNFPSVNAAQLLVGVPKSPNLASSPGRAYYAGPHLGSEPETQAVMRWLEVHIPRAAYMLDYHQQGRGFYGVDGKPWNRSELSTRHRQASQALMAHLNQDRGLPQRSPYVPLCSYPPGGSDGGDGTTTEFAVSLAAGFAYSPTYGVWTLRWQGVDLPLAHFRTLDRYPDHPLLNPSLTALTVEICRAADGLGNPAGYGSAARAQMHHEYHAYNFDTLMVFMAELALGSAVSTGH